MKKLLALIGLIAGISLSAGAQVTPIGLVWDYDLASITNVAASNQVFLIYGTTNLSQPIANWPLITNLPAVITNTISTNWPMVSFKVSIAVQPTAWFFTCTITNFWGVSPFSNVPSTPPGPNNIYATRVTRP